IDADHELRADNVEQKRRRQSRAAAEVQDRLGPLAKLGQAPSQPEYAAAREILFRFARDRQAIRQSRVVGLGEPIERRLAHSRRPKRGRTRRMRRKKTNKTAWKPRAVTVTPGPPHRMVCA